MRAKFQLFYNRHWEWKEIFRMIVWKLGDGYSVLNGRYINEMKEEEF